MGCVKLVLFFMLYTFLCQLVFSSALPHLCPEDQAHALLQFKHMFTFNPNASDICGFPSPKTLSWNKITDCCSWDGVHCEEMTGQVIELDLLCSGFQGKFHPNNSLFQLSNLKCLDLSYNNFYGSLISPKFGKNLLKLMQKSAQVDVSNDIKTQQEWYPLLDFPSKERPINKSQRLQQFWTQEERFLHKGAGSPQ
ncbi:hypothetical protein P3L10_022433 [Capsicum annuum]